MQTFGGFRSNGEFFYGEVRGDSVHVLKQPYWLGLDFDGRVLPLAISRSICRSRRARSSRSASITPIISRKCSAPPLGTPLIWFKAPSSLLPHGGTIEIAFPEHQTDFETELGSSSEKRARNVSVDQALEHVFGYTIGEDISDRDLQKSEKQFGRCKSFDTYTPVGPFV